MRARAALDFRNVQIGLFARAAGYTAAVRIGNGGNNERNRVGRLLLVRQSVSRSLWMWELIVLVVVEIVCRYATGSLLLLISYAGVGKSI